MDYFWAGDINADFLRNTCHTTTINDTVEDLSLTPSWDKFNIDFTCCHEQLGVSHVSVLDHFFWSDRLGTSVTDAGVIHALDNKSDHSPIYCSVMLPLHASQQVLGTAPHKPRPCWSKATQVQKNSYKDMLISKIDQLVTPASVAMCRNVKCQDPVHKKELNKESISLSS